MSALRIELAHTPFSRRGSYFAVSEIKGSVYLRTVHGDAEQRELMGLSIGGDPSITVHPGRLSLSTAEAETEVTLSGAGRAIVRVLRGSLTLDMQVNSQYDVLAQETTTCWRYVASGANHNYRLLVEGGEARSTSAWDGVKNHAARLVIDASERPATVTIDEFSSTPPAFIGQDFDAVAEGGEREFAAWVALHGTPATDAAPIEAVRGAAFITWAAMVPAGRLLRRESMLMSKNWMTSIWSWDHCFNAIALWREPRAAADQLLTLFDHQDEAGALPDFINDVRIEPNFVKPPIHGWAVSQLMDRGGLTDEAIGELYGPLGRWTDWWFAHRVYGDDGLPSYNHGNDSGWDNSTVFSLGVPVQSPDLLAFLALQMSALARMAAHLDLPAEAQAWRERSQATMERLLEAFWVDEKFVARHTLTGVQIQSDSLLALMPLVLGELLPTAVFERSVERLLEGGYITAHGLATEPPTSPFYTPDGYWRGPIWAPTTVLLTDGLRRGGRADLADDIEARFIATCAAAGMAENFDALTGEGLRDRSMTWTASAFLTLTTSPTLGAAGATHDLEVSA